MSNQDNFNVSPIKPTIRLDDTNKTRPLGTPKSMKDFRNYLDNDKGGDEPLAVDERDASAPSLFELPHKKKLMNKDAKNVPIQAQDKNASLFESSTVVDKAKDNPLAPIVPQKKEKPPLIGKKDREGNVIIGKKDRDGEVIQKKSNAPIGDVRRPIEDDEDEEDVAVDVDAEMDPDMDIADLEIIARKKRFEVPTKPIFPGDDDMIAELTNPKLMGLKKEDEKGSFESGSSAASDQKGMGMPTPIANSPFIGGMTAAIKDPQASRAAVKALVDQIVQTIETVRKDGMTETIVTLRHPPILEGSKLTLTTFEGAHNEFNVGFSNLSADGKNFLDRNLLSLNDSLNNNRSLEGYVVNVLPTVEAQAAPHEEHFAHGDESHPQQQNQQQKEQEEELET